MSFRHIVTKQPGVHGQQSRRSMGNLFVHAQKKVGALHFISKAYWTYFCSRGKYKRFAAFSGERSTQTGPIW